MKRLIRKILREEIEKSDRHYRRLDIISDHVQLPYFESMEGLTIDDKEDQEYIMRKILGNDIIKIVREKHWIEVYDRKKGNIIYWENYVGEWQKRERDDNGNLIYSEDSDGRCVKREYDDKGNGIYYEDSYGDIRDYR